VHVKLSPVCGLFIERVKRHRRPDAAISDFQIIMHAEIASLRSQRR
jgi:hypothetical protein